MTVEEMKSKIKKHCDSRCICMYNETDGCSCPLWKSGKYNFCCECGDNVEGLKSNYEAIFGKPQFTLSDIKAGYLVRIRSGELLIVIPQEDGVCGLYDEKHARFSDIDGYNEDMTDVDKQNEFDIMEVYGLSKYNMFNIANRELLYKREVDPNLKVYTIQDIKVSPNCNTYDTDKAERQIFIENINHKDRYFDISIDTAKELISSLQEIVDYVEGVK